MIIYGQKEHQKKFQALLAEDEHLRHLTGPDPVYTDDPAVLGGPAEGIPAGQKLTIQAGSGDPAKADAAGIDPSRALLVLDTRDHDAAKRLYAAGRTDVWLPACGTILNVNDPAADEILEKQVSLGKGWFWHKERNRFKLLRAFLQHRTYADMTPLHIQLEHTSYCNARCIMCGHSVYDNHNAKHLSKELFARVQSLLPGCEMMVLHGYGEPFLTKDLTEILKVYADYNVEVTSNTNMTYLPDDLLHVLPSVMKHLRISCEGVTKEMYEGIRPGLRFEEFTDNLRRIKAYAPQIDLMMESVIMRQNVEQMPEMVRFAHEYGFSQISLNRLGPHPGLNNEMDSLVHYPALTDYYLRKAIEEADRLGIRIFLPSDWLLPPADREAQMEEERAAAAKLPFVMEPMEFGRQHEEMIRRPVRLRENLAIFRPGSYQCFGNCDSLLGRTNIDQDGNVFTCCINAYMSTGNLFEQTDEEMYNTPVHQLLRQKFYDGIVPLYCENCTYVMNRTLALADLWKTGGSGQAPAQAPGQPCGLC